ncbi:hypothetical protein M758_1G257500 [Ceratodon purpureus]|uniref:Uncharacterized protein n=1 Tax=Ceratodon purpureus TaxID=3225 RepID=A0A8T0JCF2_CERPU|nr:hypothetical protein KC19_1G264000 [Ceratodon purpureus]KAG0631489.1 hypothetical protein M758_1G257500 [Ceratodon purpureus]
MRGELKILKLVSMSEIAVNETLSRVTSSGNRTTPCVRKFETTLCARRAASQQALCLFGKMPKLLFSLSQQQWGPMAAGRRRPIAVIRDHGDLWPQDGSL